MIILGDYFGYHQGMSFMSCSIFHEQLQEITQRRAVDDGGRGEEDGAKSQEV